MRKCLKCLKDGLIGDMSDLEPYCMTQTIMGTWGVICLELCVYVVYRGERYTPSPIIFIRHPQLPLPSSSSSPQISLQNLKFLQKKPHLYKTPTRVWKPGYCSFHSGRWRFGWSIGVKARVLAHPLFTSF